MAKTATRQAAPAKPITPTKPPPPKPNPPPPRPAATARQHPSALVPTPRTTVPVTTESQALMEEMRQDAGLGISFAPQDNITPNISVLQPMSPMVLDGNAKPGDFLVANGDPPTVDGSSGFYFQPCAVTQWWFEFVPREEGGGFVARYPAEYDDRGQIIAPPGAELKDSETRYRYWFPDSGHECTHYRFVAGIMWRDGVGMEYVIQFHGTGHTVARNWNTAWGQKRLTTGAPRPACASVYRVWTSQRSNKKGTWYQLVYDGGTPVEAAGEIVGDIYDAYHRGKGLALAFKAGEKVESVVHEEESYEGTGNGSGDAAPGADKDIPY
jgi:hypothetical protein